MTGKVCVVSRILAVVGKVSTQAVQLCNGLGGGRHAAGGQEGAIADAARGGVNQEIAVGKRFPA